jgi:methenyltetrahydrofolate cyclohydrolase
MPSIPSLTVNDLLDAFASTAPAPGGGSASALAGAVGVSLLVMAADIRMSRESDSAGSAGLAQAADRLRALRSTIASLVDRDAEAYVSVIAARRLPVGGEESEAHRRAAYESAIRAATDVPLETMRACHRALREAPLIASHSIRSTQGDVGVAIELLSAAVRGAGLTVDANLETLGDIDYVHLSRAERQRLESESAADAEIGLSRLQEQYG